MLMKLRCSPSQYSSGSGLDPIKIRVLHSMENIAEITYLLHRAYGNLANMGLKYLAAHQSDEVTRNRILSGECWVALTQDTLVGTILFKNTKQTDGSPWLDRPEVASFGQLAVHPELQGTGLGCQLISIAEMRASETGATEIALDTAEPAEHLVAFYNRLGYRLIERAQWSHANYGSVILSKSVQ
ncbi:GNAT family N-acetyltransferase [Acetobacter senegalensis]|uniref:GNAT family N-acetyltransferase n=1 Tax=Acetobacter senegalensis TaxID=446692 RepID=UPI00209E8FD7|nr:GNAT family N-acetyltransferase [Acetobacter senegalensis]MCP1196636.1 GNAT family N-acetyltransferase [Acetobacter senegalensis]